MTDVEAYEEALRRWGDVGGVWKMGPARLVVGRWIALGKMRDDGADPIVLRTAAKGFEVKGEGASWEAAFAVADVTTTKGGTDAGVE